MIMTAGYLWAEVQKALRLYGNDDMTSIQQSSNMAYFHLYGLRSWVQGRRKASINFASHDSNNAMVLPSDLAGIDAVWSSEYQFFPSEWSRAEKDTSEDDATHRFFYTEPVSDALAIIPSISIVNGANTFSGGTWDASYIGEYFRIASELGIYKFTAERTFTPRWYGPDISGAPTDVIQVRPAGTKMFSIVDDTGAFVESTVTMYYWAYPVPLYQECQPILLPDFKALELLTIINVLGLKDRKEAIADRYRIEYDKALSIMESLNPEFQSPHRPLDRYGDQIRFK